MKNNGWLQHYRHTSKGFTLIELLIVVAIIAILAAIAVPNFLEAQVRAKVSRVKADFRSLAIGIEAYAVDNRSYPWRKMPAPYTDSYGEISARMADLTSPIAYLTSVAMNDPFITQGTNGGYNDGFAHTQYNYRNYQFFGTASSNALFGTRAWALNSLGPDHWKNQGLNIEYCARNLSGYSPSAPTKYCVIYDPTNGTVSAGDIPWTGGDSRRTN